MHEKIISFQPIYMSLMKCCKIHLIILAQERGDYEWSLNQSKKVMKRIENWSEDDIPERKEYTAHLHSYIGNAYLELGDYKNALRHHQLDREIAEQQLVIILQSIHGYLISYHIHCHYISAVLKSFQSFNLH